jgi:hypothetical protein
LKKEAALGVIRSLPVLVDSGTTRSGGKYFACSGRTGVSFLRQTAILLDCYTPQSTVAQKTLSCQSLSGTIQEVVL